MSRKPAVDPLKWLEGLMPVAKLLKGAGYKTTKLDLHRADEVHAAVERLANAASAGNVMAVDSATSGKREALWFSPDKADELRAALAAFRGEQP